MNGLMPQGPQQAGPQLGPMPHPAEAMIPEMEATHASARAKLDKMDEVAAQARAVREQMTHLATLGDLVNEEDVVAAAAKIVSAGVAPMKIAAILADMPSGGEALTAWISGQAQQFAQKEAQINAILAGVRHETGLTALRLLAAQSLGDMAMAPGGAPGSNPLSPQGPGLGAPMPQMGSMAPQGAPLAGNPLMMEEEDAA